MSEHVFERAPELTYGIVMLIVDVIWVFLARALAQENGEDSTIAKSMKKIGYKKSAITLSLITAGIIVGIFIPMATLISCLLSLVPWVVPDRDIEKRLHE
jgi:uncharacterized membrane protein